MILIITYYKTINQVTSYLIGMVPIINISYLGAGGGIGISMLPILMEFICIAFTLVLILVTCFFLGK
jgi:hypothetical protein